MKFFFFTNTKSKIWLKGSKIDFVINLNMFSKLLSEYNSSSYVGTRIDQFCSKTQQCQSPQLQFINHQFNTYNFDMIGPNFWSLVQFEYLKFSSKVLFNLL